MPIYNIYNGWTSTGPPYVFNEEEEEEYWFIYGDDEENNFGIEYDYGSDDEDEESD